VEQESRPVFTLRNTDAYLASVMSRPELAARAVRPPKKVGTRLALFDCLSCDKCLPVCPNHALFTFTLASPTIPFVVLERGGDKWTVVERGEIATTRRHQIGVFADFCNECGNCDVFCPEHGGPYKTKPRLFGSEEAWTATPLDGFWMVGSPDEAVMRGRIGGRQYRLERAGGRARFAGDGFDVVFDENDPAGTIDGRATGRVDLAPCALMMALGRGVLDRTRVNYINALG
jgi:putative selenate reductase